MVANNLLNSGSITWDTAAAWQVADTGGAQTTRTSTTNTTTSAVANGTAFTLTNTKTIDGVLMHVSRVTSTGTVTIELHDGTSVVATCTVNASALPVAKSWIFFVWDVAYVSTGLTTMKVQIKGSSNANAQFGRSGTAADWARLFRMTDTATIATTDNTYITGKMTSASGGTLTAYTVTYNVTATTTWGLCSVGMGGTFLSQKTAATNYYIKLGASFEGFDQATIDIGTVAASMPADSTFTMEFVNASNNDFGLDIREGCKFDMYHARARSRGMKLAADVAAAATTSTLNGTPTNWKNGDTVVFAPTGTTTTEGETRVLNGDVSSSSFTWTSGLTNAHKGTSPRLAEVINITRGIVVKGTSTTLCATVRFGFATGALIDARIYNVEFKNCVSVRTIVATGTFILDGCSIHDSTATGNLGIDIGLNVTTATFTFNNIDIYNINAGFLMMTVTISGAVTLTNITGITQTANSNAGFSFTSDFVGAGTVITGITSAGCAGVGLKLPVPTTLGGISATFDSWTIHSCGTNAINSTVATKGGYTVSNLKIWCVGTVGIIFGGAVANMSSITFDTFSIEGCNGNGIVFQEPVDNITFKNGNLNPLAGITQPIGVQFNTARVQRIRFETVTFGAGTVHGTADLDVNVSGIAMLDVQFNNCAFNTSTEIQNQTNMIARSWIGSTKHDQTAGTHKAWGRCGTIQSDTTRYGIASPSTKMTPNNATAYCLRSFAPRRAPVKSGKTITMAVRIRKSNTVTADSFANDASTYNGSQPTLWVKANPAIGITSDTQLAITTSASDGKFATISGATIAATDDGVMEFEVRCDGTVGNIWVEEVRAS